MPNKQNIVPSIHTSDNLQTLYVDGVTSNKREDGMYFIRFTTDIPEGTFEQFRIMTDEQHLHNILDVLCRYSNHYPEKSVKLKKPKPPK
jgi:hypothetical protein